MPSGAGRRPVRTTASPSTRASQSARLGEDGTKESASTPSSARPAEPSEEASATVRVQVPPEASAAAAVGQAAPCA